MILILAATAAAATLPLPKEERFNACVELAVKSPVRAIETANSWLIEGGGVLARQCLGLAYATDARWLSAATAFEQAARQAEREGDGRSANLWVQAGNAALAGSETARARGYLDSALIGGLLQGAEKGEAHLDRARALVLLKQNAAARADFDAALKLVPADPLAWLLSATLARRMEDLPRATKDITEASRLSPDDAQVALEAGNIAILNGSPGASRVAWEAAVKNAPTSPAGKAAADALKQFESVAKVK
jgi:tetratricopeptide (TPR) repeat protein